MCAQTVGLIYFFVPLWCSTSPLGLPSVTKSFYKFNITQIKNYVNENQASIVEIVSVVSSSTSRSTLTVSKLVKIFTLFSIAHDLIL